MTVGARPSASGDAHNATATASTLNYALGRKHMKSWMSGATDQPLSTPPVPPTPSCLSPNPAPLVVFEKRGGPRKYPRPEAVDHQHATGAPSVDDRPTIAPPTERLTPSNSTSPQLANIVTDQPRSRSHGNLDVAVWPSPTPSEEDAHDSDLQVQELRKRPPVNIDRFDCAPSQSPNASGPDPAAAIERHLRQDPSPPKRQAEEGSTSAEKRARIDTSQFPASTPTVAFSSDLPTFPEFPRRTSAPHTQTRSTSLGRAPSRSPYLGQIPNRQLASPQLMQTSQHSGGLPGSRGNPSPVQDISEQNAPVRQTYITPQLSAQPFGMPLGFQQFVQPSVVLSQRRASYHSDWYTVDDCKFELRSLDAIYPVTIRNRKDAIRLQVLEEAVMAHDWAYLTLHQYYCIMNFSPQNLPLTLQRNGNLHVAQSLLREVLDDNMQLSPTVLAFFCTFPCAVETLISTWPARYQQAEREFASFVTYSPNAGALRQVSERRRVPPTPREFANCAITSKTFQRLLFRSVLRVLWGGFPHIPEKGHFEEQALNAFSQAQTLFEQRRAAGKLGGREQTDFEWRGWKHNFVQITNSFEASLQRRGFQPLYPTPFRLNQQQQQRDQSQVKPHQRIHTAPGSADIAVSRRTQAAPPSTLYPRPASQAHTSSGPRQGSTALLPRRGVNQPQQRVPAPSRFGLHQAHLRSPVLQVANLSSPSYYFWQGFVLKPQRLKNANTAIERLSFTLTAKELEVIAKTMPTAPGAADTRSIDENHKLIRLRCVKWPADPTPKDEEWAIADNSWVPHSYFTLNGVPLQLRKKLHYGKDLPVDLTSMVKKDENVLEISVMSNSDDHNYRNYLVAVEFLGVMTGQSIEKRCREKAVAAQAVISDIKRKLSPSATDDDDIVLMESTLTINLRDPFSASKICDIPVRGKACLHNECFDLDTFLETRPRKGDMTAADQWRCPICKADARPNSLAVDGFLVEVRKELERKGLLDTRAITVSQDGSWNPKPEERDPNGVSDRDTPEPTPAAGRIASRSNSKSAVVHEIIDLSD